MIRAYLLGTGPGTVVPGGLHAFMKTRPELAVPDIEFMFVACRPARICGSPGIRKFYLDGYGIRPTLLHPDSRARSRCARPIRSRRCAWSQFFTAPNDLLMRRRKARATSPLHPMDAFHGEELAPGPKVKTDDEIDA
jgi:hypothetical protein